MENIEDPREGYCNIRDCRSPCAEGDPKPEQTTPKSMKMGIGTEYCEASGCRVPIAWDHLGSIFWFEYLIQLKELHSRATAEKEQLA